MPSLVAVAGSMSLNPVFSASGVKGKRVAALTKECDMSNLIKSIIADKPDMDSSFCVLDLGVVMDLMDNWVTKLPTVQPYYAVKCNPNLSLIGALAALGSGFDCASKAEIEAVLSIGVSPDRIVYANPCKSESDIRYAANVGVNLTTFDSVYEVDKIKKWHPTCELLLRIKSLEDIGARACLGIKYGALPEEVPELLRAADVEGLKVTGATFHIGSGGADTRPYRGAIAAAKSVFETARGLGMSRMHILDIGGGFTSGPQFEAAAAKVNAAIQTHFGDEEGLVVIGEPGRYFAETTFTLASKVFGKRVRGEVREYWINDGIYGSLNNIIFDFATVKCSSLMCASKPHQKPASYIDGAKTYHSTVFGPTCDSADIVFKDYQLPELEVNDWLMFPNMGAYTISSGTNFNGFTSAVKNVYLACSSPVAREQAIF